MGLKAGRIGHSHSWDFGKPKITTMLLFLGVEEIKDRVKWEREEGS